MLRSDYCERNGMKGDIKFYTNKTKMNMNAKCTIQLLILILYLFTILIGCIVIHHGVSWSLDDPVLSSYLILFFTNPGNTVVLFGATIVLISLAGLCLTCFCKDVAVSKMHVLFLVLITLCQIAYAMDIVVLNQLPSFLKSNLRYGINYYKFNSSDIYSIAWDRIQQNRQCCGIYNFSDWYECDDCLTLNSFPHSCCNTINDNKCEFENMNSTSTYDSQVVRKGCFTSLLDVIGNYFLHYVVWFVCLICTQVGIIILTLAYISQLQNHKQLVKKCLDDGKIEENECDDSLEMSITEATKMIRKREIKRNNED